MKTIIKTALTVLTGIVMHGQVYTQNMNWQSLKSEDKHILSVSTGIEYGVIYGAGYGYHIRTGLPVVLNLEYSFPSGSNLTDDFKSKIGGRVRLFGIQNFMLSANIYGVFRRYENDLVRMLNFGSELSGILGYYRAKWFVAGEFGFDKAIVTNLKHSQNYRDIFPEVTDGWYEPATGGNYHYGLQTGFSFKQHDISLKAGRLITQDFKTEPIVPYYAQLSYNFRLRSATHSN
jgi:hypothetical protein